MKFRLILNLIVNLMLHNYLQPNHHHHDQDHHYLFVLF